MVSCLTLIDRTHRLVSVADGMAQTACGLALAEDLVGAHLFAANDALPTCERCSSSGPARSPKAVPKAPREVVRSLLEATSIADAPLLATLLNGSSDAGAEAATAALTRLHALFPRWKAIDVDLIVDGPRVVARYQVECFDPGNLLGRSKAESQVVIFAVHAGRVTSATPVVDDFGFWSALTQTRPPISIHEVSDVR